MYTQCEHCKAIFRVNMREVTVAQGKLRCGECMQVFNATASLTTTLPSTYKELVDVDVEPESSTEDKLNEDNTTRLEKATNSFTVKTIEAKKDKEPLKINGLLVITLFLLALLLTQIFYNNRYFFLGYPRHQPEKIQMLNHNVFAHPNESGVLLISALIENTAEQEQPYPVLELRLTNSQSKLIALRRFFPSEYLDKATKQSLIPSKKPINLRIKIKDPGSSATHFQFKFL